MQPGEIAVEDSDFEAPPAPPPRFGGAANEWIVRLPWHRRGVRMLPLSPIDLESRPWIPNSGWPLGWDELARYYARAHELLELGRFDYEPTHWGGPRAAPLEVSQMGLTSGIERFARAEVFTTRAWDELRRSPNVAVHLGASVGTLGGSHGSVDRAEIDNGERGRLHVTADVFVLAASGFENPRLLLMSDGGRGIGNEHDVVGRYHMDHVRAMSGVVVPRDAAWFERLALYDIRNWGGELVMAKLVPTPGAMRQGRLLHSGAMLLPRLAPHIRQAASQLAAAGRAVRVGRRPDAVPNGRALAVAAASLARTAVEMSARQRRFPPRTDAGWSHLHGNRRRWASFDVEHQFEQAPNADNRIRLGDRADEYGRPRPILRWTWGELDLRSIRQTQELFGNAVVGCGLGEFEPTPWDGPPELTTPGGSFHPMGGTRMHTDPRHGVVDRHGQVHGWRNLFVAGSSVFPTGGYANPTLTVVALAIRLADEIERRFRTRHW